ncbi:tetratricopeptide repeat protein [Sphingomonas sp. MG17]|uniref:Tetratricopeptide repeat protein n=1 Tax=Sphingomonas tagetis TaxID=2949092 RepID=A0A9X2HTC7_9SPHN|nr:tetratricopeptide repeat protein [Sphingomonas tagetis]MCP3732275.1 tetratricopeptide repeat protein [Sphingomonas tagetis]
MRLLLPFALALLAAPAAARAEPLPYPDGFLAAFGARDLVIAAAIVRPRADACEAQRPADDRCINLYLGAALVDLSLAEQVGGRDGEAGRTVPRAHHYFGIHAADDPDSIGLVNQMLGRLRLVQWRHAEAEDAFRAAYAAYLRVRQPDVQAIASALNNVAHAVAAQGREADATPLYREVLATLRRQTPADAAGLLAALSSLGTSLDRTGRSAEAEPLFREALALAVAEYGEGAAGTARHIANLAVNLERLGRLGEAEALHRRALAIREEAGEADGLQRARLNLAANLYDQRRFGEAEALAIAPLAAASGRERDDPVRIEAAQQLGMIWSWLPARRPGARTLLREAVAGTMIQAAERPGFDPVAQARLAAARPAMRRSVAVAWALAQR